MSLETYVAASAVILAVFFAVVGLTALIAVRRSRRRCAYCGTKLPAGASECPHCDSLTPPEPATPQERQPLAPPAETIQLIATDGPLAGRRFPIPAQGLSIGRQPDNDVILADQLTVSRHHAVVTVESGQPVLYDRDSANGTWVNGQRVFRHVLEPGDRIQIWESQFAFATSQTPPPSPPPLVVDRPALHVTGDDFCGYRLESLIGRGGMSEVFRALDANGRVVAIKILQQTDPYLVEKFVQEGNQIGPLLRGHANIAFVHEFGKSPDNRLYIVMEYIDAPSLRKAMRRPIDEAETVKIIGQLCGALAFAHNNDIVHRDVKPENILVTDQGVVKVLDFGIAKLTSASTVTRDKIVGTPEYISPEQARGERVLPASDVYSVGVVLYELLTGSVPFRRPPDQAGYRAALEVVGQHLHAEPEPIRKRNPNVRVSARVERATMRALKKDLRQRYRDAGSLGRDLGYREETRTTQPSPQAKQANLSILQGPRQGSVISLVGESLVLGRFELGSTDTAISRRHARVFYRGDGYWLEDSSKNGTWVDERRIYGEVPLRVGARITIGDNVLRLDPA
ncbi:MAG: protein kinase domain-containing protein [Anaerolineae bacterium]|jgi:serine/threonine protein kinase